MSDQEAYHPSAGDEPNRFGCLVAARNIVQNP